MLLLLPWWEIRMRSLQWRHNGCDGVSNHQPHDCSSKRLFRCRSKKTSKLRFTGLFSRGIRRWPGKSPHKWPVTRRMLPFKDVIMLYVHHIRLNTDVSLGDINGSLTEKNGTLSCKFGREYNMLFTYSILNQILCAVLCKSHFIVFALNTPLQVIKGSTRRC